VLIVAVMGELHLSRPVSCIASNELVHSIQRHQCTATGVAVIERTNGERVTSNKKLALSKSALCSSFPDRFFSISRI
jgi:hypothetical protein